MSMRINFPLTYFALALSLSCSSNKPEDKFKSSPNRSNVYRSEDLSRRFAGPKATDEQLGKLRSKSPVSYFKAMLELASNSEFYIDQVRFVGIKDKIESHREMVGLLNENFGSMGEILDFLDGAGPTLPHGAFRGVIEQAKLFMESSESIEILTDKARVAITSKNAGSASEDFEGPLGFSLGGPPSDFYSAGLPCPVPADPTVEGEELATHKNLDAECSGVNDFISALVSPEGYTGSKKWANQSDKYDHSIKDICAAATLRTLQNAVEQLGDTSGQTRCQEPPHPKCADDEGWDDVSKACHKRL